MVTETTIAVDDSSPGAKKLRTLEVNKGGLVEQEVVTVADGTGAEVITKCDTDNVKVIGDGRTYKRVANQVAIIGDNTIIAAVAGKKIKVYDYSIQNVGGTTGTVATFQDGAGGAQISQEWSFQDREGKNKHGIAPGQIHDFETSAGNLLNMTLSAAIAVSYEIIYTDSDAS